jgi:hypothetical protein
MTKTKFMTPWAVCRYLKDLVTEWGAQIYVGAIGHEKCATNDSPKICTQNETRNSHIII